MKHLFAYGVLMCEDIISEITGSRLSHVPGTLKGFCRKCLRGEHYPAVIPEATGSVDGLVYRDIPDTTWKRLDLFEGEMYARRPVWIELSDRTTLEAETYVLQTAFSNCISQFDWNFSDFLVNGKKEFRQRFRGYRVI